MRPLYLHGLGHFHPENVIDNRFLEDLDIGTDDEWILERVGIRERRTVLPLEYIRETRNADVRAGQEAALYSNVDTGEQAAAMALGRAGLIAKDIGMVVAGSASPEMSTPAEACRIAARLGIEAPAVDINTGCASFGAQLHLLASMTDLPEYVLAVNAENMTRVVNYADRTSCVLWGDGACAAVVSNSPSRVRVVESMFASSPAGWAQITIPRLGHFAQEGNAVQRFAIKTTQACVEAMLPAARARLAATGGRLHVVSHQANLLVIEAVARRAGIAEQEQWHNIVVRGNTAAAGAPSVLSEHWDELANGDVAILTMVGAGLAWSSLRIEVD